MFPYTHFYETIRIKNIYFQYSTRVLHTVRRLQMMNCYNTKKQYSAQPFGVTELTVTICYVHLLYKLLQLSVTKLKIFLFISVSRPVFLMGQYVLEKCICPGSI